MKGAWDKRAMRRATIANKVVPIAGGSAFKNKGVQYLVDAVGKRDVPGVLACGVIFAAVYIILNIVADVVSILANPRLRHPK